MSKLLGDFSRLLLGAVELGDQLGFRILLKKPIVVDDVFSIGRNVDGRVVLIKLLHGLLLVEDGQDGRLLVRLLVLVLRPLLFTVVLLC